MISQEEKDDFVGRRCFLDNKPAKIVGRKLDFPKIVTFDGTNEVEFSWEAVKRIMGKDGKFWG